jgi:hypothetical protein
MSNAVFFDHIEVHMDNIHEFPMVKKVSEKIFN